MKKINSATFIAAMAISANVFASSLNLTTFNPGSDAIFPVSSTLIYGDRDAVLVDAQFQKKYAKEVIDIVNASGRDLKYIYISHSDPDYYFGLDEIKKAFPKAQVVSTAQTAYLISASKDTKLEVWKEKLGSDAPEKLYVPEAVTTNKLVIDGENIYIRQVKGDSAHSYLWVPSLKTVLGGIPVSEGGHLWMADTSTAKDIDRWINVIDDMRSLKPEKVIPGHYVKSDFSPAILGFVRKYLSDYKVAASTNKDASGIIAELEKAYPDLPGKESLEFGAKVFTGELPWHVTSPYPPIGSKAEIHFGDTVFELTFKDNHTMSFIGTSGAFKGVTDTVEYLPIEVSKNVFMVYWNEPHTGSNVVHVQDWNTGTVYTNIAAKDYSFTHLKGTIALKD
ncbi:MBL fold hydrolase [Pectobacterium zantedeschiae]|uniref:MBL fold metallo-hydrolase n=2 Tax=Pectobacterium zantedeschiae TaxID=2034769 RepID=A0A9X8JNE6_9GAMM|nr:MBL fold hydrolase [Pectobacterium zantedeschiae]RYC42630.1 MBL fold hydrolase [Pectobacterium zantedeschiae]RYC46248.1 MBL fold metallo-hydrolase [Pectobacterium zantedeschiae]